MSNSNYITRAALFTAANIILLLLSQTLKSNTLSFLVLASFTTAFAVLATDIRHAIIAYIATSMLSFILLPDKTIVLAYVLFFGVYGLVKLYAERVANSYIQFMIKTIYFSGSFYILYLIAGKLFIDIDAISQRFGFPVYLFIIMFILLFNLYDFVYTAVVGYFRKRAGQKR